MAKSVKGTQTEKNLLTSFAGESQARMRYTYFASVGKKRSDHHAFTCGRIASVCHIIPYTSAH